MPQRLAQHLIARGLLPASTVDEALKRLKREGGSLDTALLEMGVVSEAGVLQAISDVSNVRLVNLADFEPNTEAGPLMPFKVAKQLCAVPLSLDGNALHLAAAYPIPHAQLKEAGFLLGRKLELWVSLECRIRDWQSVVYGQPLEPRLAKLLCTLDPARKPPREPEPEADKSLAPEVLERLAKGIVEEPLLLDRPKQKKKGPKPQLTPLGEDEEPHTTVFEPTAYERFARGGDEAPAAVPSAALGEVESTRVLDLHGYSNFAREMTRRDRSDTDPEVPAVRMSFPGGVLPPRPPTIAPVASAPAAPAPAAPPRGVPKVERPAPPPAQRPPPHDETDFSDVVPGRPQQPTPRVTAAPAVPAPTPVMPVRQADLRQLATPLGSPAAPTPVAPQARARPAEPPPPQQPPEPATAATLAEAAPRPTPEPPPSRATPYSGRPTPMAFPIPVLPPQPAEPAPTAAIAQTATESVAPYPSDEAAPPYPSPDQPVPPYPSPDQPVPAPPQAEPPTAPSWPTPLAMPAPAVPPPNVSRPPLYAGVRVIPGPSPEPSAAPPGWQQPLQAGPALAGPMQVDPSALLMSPPGLSPSPATEWTLAQARASLRASTNDRDALISVVLDYGRRTFDFIAAFAVMRGAAVGWDARGADDATAMVRQLAVPLDAASVFRTVALTRGSYVGPLPPDALSQHYLALLARSPRTVFLWPIEVRSRLVAVLYGDCGSRPVSQRRLADFILFCQDLPTAFQQLILHRKQQNPQAAPLTTGVALEAVQAPAPPPQEVQGTDEDWFGGLITLLTGPDPSERSMAMLELMKTPDASAQAIARAFPGPTGWSRLPVVELPEPDELGPLPGALARLGQAGAAALAPLLDSPDSDTRYLALLTAGSLRYPEVIDGVLRGLFDMEPDLSSAARSAAAALRYLPQFQQHLPDLRRELASADPLRRSLAARALGVLRDRESIDVLIVLSGTHDELSAQSAADALKEITRTSHGTNARAWAGWWAQHRDRRRVEWLVDALEAEEFELRLAAVEELSRAFGDTRGFFADAPVEERATAVAQWRSAVASRPEFDL